MNEDRPLNILFLCTGNSARSVLGEALVNYIGKAGHIGQSSGRAVCGFSAGSTPVGQVNPVALEVLEAYGVETAGLRSKSWDEFAEPAAPSMDVIITVCDNAAGETCPIWPGHPAMGHWGLPDPAAAEGDHSDVLAAFEAIFHILRERLEKLLGSDALTAGGDELCALLGQLGGGSTGRGSGGD